MCSAGARRNGYGSEWTKASRRRRRRRLQLPVCRSGGRQSRGRDCGYSRRSKHVLCRRIVGRSVEDDSWWFNWRPIFDSQDVAAIGALAVAPSSPNIVWAGTGEAWAIRDIDVAGDGVYEGPLDAGKTWKNMGLTETGRIGRIVIDPKNADNIYVCALGRLAGPHKEKGVYHSTDGGKNWTQSLFVNDNTGCSGLNMDTHDSNTLIAGMWQVEMHTWGEFSGGEGSGVYITHDGGVHWRHVEGHGMPKPPVGKIDVAIAPTDSNRMYALIETKNEGSFWRSDDGGDNWHLTSWDRTLLGARDITFASLFRRRMRTRFCSQTAGSTLLRMEARRGRRFRGAATTTTSGSIRRIRTALL